MKGKPNLMELSDSISRKTAQLEALVLVASSEAVSLLSDDLKANYLWLCSDLATQVREEFDVYHSLVRTQKSIKPESSGGAS